MARTNAQHEIVERLIVDVHESDLHGESKVGQVRQVLPSLFVRLLVPLSEQYIRMEKQEVACEE